tara:strand:+ start:6741 stop:7109 length:369 start_codon:yes stop_codon:yes gene_type:complete
MGVFTNIEVHIEFMTKDDYDRAFSVMENFRDEIKKHIYKDKPFHVNDLHIQGDNLYVEVGINSGREPNARFHVNCLIKLFQIHKISVDTFNADIIQPEAYLSFDSNNDDSESRFENYDVIFE